MVIGGDGYFTLTLITVCVSGGAMLTQLPTPSQR